MDHRSFSPTVNFRLLSKDALLHEFPIGSVEFFSSLDVKESWNMMLMDSFMADEYSLSHRSIVTLEHSITPKERYVAFGEVILSPYNLHGNIYVSPLIAFHLHLLDITFVLPGELFKPMKYSGMLRIIDVLPYHENLRLLLRRNKKRKENRLVQSATLQRIRMSNCSDIDENKLKDILIDYFSIPRWIIMDGMIILSLREESSNEIKSKNGIDNELLFFKVSSISTSNECVSGNGPFFLIKDDADLITGPDISSFVLPKAVISSFQQFFTCLDDITNPIVQDLSISTDPCSVSHLFSELLFPFYEGDLKVYSILVTGPYGIGKRHLIRQATANMGIPLYELSSYDLGNDITTAEAQLEELKKKISNLMQNYLPCIFYLRDFFLPASENPTVTTLEEKWCETLTIWLNDTFQNVIHGTFVLIASTESPDDLPQSVRSVFTTEFSVSFPSSLERKCYLRTQYPEFSEDIIDDVVINTENMTYHHIDLYVSNMQRIDFETLDDKKDNDDGFALTYINPLESSNHQSNIPSVQWDDIGGLETIKDTVQDFIRLPKSSSLCSLNSCKCASFLQSGILLYGPPGTGKTMVAKAIATTYQMSFIHVKGPELLNMYIGESEKNIRDIFSRAKMSLSLSKGGRTVLFFDEIESLVPSRNLQNDQNHVMDRVVTQFLLEFDALHPHILVIGATNRPDLLDPALLRPGRFGHLLYLGPCKKADEIESILHAITSKFSFHPNVNLNEIAKECLRRQPYYTGADLYSICSKALTMSFREVCHEIEHSKDQDKVQTKEIIVKWEHFMHALDNLQISVSKEKLTMYESLQQKYS